jgi:DNA helicase-2/ATP-dependent DNA helicase PcrA
MDPKQYDLHVKQENYDFKIDYKAELNDIQYSVVAEGDGPCLVLAGAGSGKTRTLVYRVAYLLEKGVKPENILLVTFTNKAAREMLERVEELLGYRPKGLWGGTFHSVANRLLRMHGEKLGYTKDFGILDSDDSRKLLKQVQKELGIPKESYIPKIKVIHGIISFSKNAQKSIEEVVNHSYSYLIPEVIPHLERIAQAYEGKKKDANVMDFDDMLSNWLKLMADVPELGQRISQQFQYVLVDEFQDTNIVQAKIVQKLALPQNNLLVVGDDAQSIYSFRAATVDNILSFQKVYPNAKLFKLETNYRSTPEILRLANESIRQNQFQYEKSLKTWEGDTREAKKPILIPASDTNQQAQIIAQRTLEMTDAGLSLKDIAVLFRSSFHIIELELELQRRGIPYVIRGGLRFFEQAHIKDVMAYLEVLQNPRNEISWRRIMGLYEGVGPATATKAWKRMKEAESLAGMLSVLGEMPGRGKAAASFGRMQRVFFKLMEIPRDNISDLIHAVLEQGYQMVLESSYDDAKDRLEDLTQLALFSTNYPTMAEFLAEASLTEGFKGEKAGAQEEEPEEALLLSTIHQAKGLEWQAVFALGLAEGLFPHYRVLEKPKEMEEERRLFYVTVTRAKEHLYMIYPIMTRSYATGDKINRPSLFLREIDEDLFETWNINEITSQPVVKFKDHKEDTDVNYVDEHSEESGGSIFDIIRGI